MLLFTRFIPYDGIALYPFILLKERKHRSDQVLLNHERIHLQQQKELLVIFFYLLYILHYLLNLIYYRDHHKAYRNIIFEREAYAHEKQLSYLQTRPLFAMFRT